MRFAISALQRFLLLTVDFVNGSVYLVNDLLNPLMGERLMSVSQ
jgi:hypothetical protein